MAGIRITTRTNLKLDISNIYDSINNNKPKSALRHLDSAEKNIVVYYNTRGLGCDNFYPHFSKIRNLLYRFRCSPLYKKKIYGYLLNLNKEMRAAVFSKDGEVKESVNPVEMLKRLSDDLIDDYSEFDFSGGREVLERNRNILELIRNDLLEMRELEPLFKNKGKEEQGRYNLLLKCVNQCLMILPQANDVSISTSTSKTLRTYFESLFHALSDIFMPANENEESDMEKKEEVESKRLKAQVQMPEKSKEPDGEVVEKEDENNFERKSLKRMTDDLGVDLKEMERKAKERIENIGKKEEEKDERD